MRQTDLTVDNIRSLVAILRPTDGRVTTTTERSRKTGCNNIVPCEFLQMRVYLGYSCSELFGSSVSVSRLGLRFGLKSGRLVVMHTYLHLYFIPLSVVIVTELDMGPFLLTQSNTIHQLMDPIQSNPIYKVA